MKDPNDCYLGYYQINDGWNGDKDNIHLVYDPKTLLTYEVHAKWGFYRSTIPPCPDAREARYILETRPTERQRYKEID